MKPAQVGLVTDWKEENVDDEREKGQPAETFDKVDVKPVGRNAVAPIDSFLQAKIDKNKILIENKQEVKNVGIVKNERKKLPEKNPWTHKFSLEKDICRSIYAPHQCTVSGNGLGQIE